MIKALSSSRRKSFEHFIK